MLFLFVHASCLKKQVNSEFVELDKFLRTADKTNMLISPSGDFISYVSLYKNRPNLFITNLLTNTATQLTFDTLVGINKYIWLNDSIILYLYDKDQKDNYHLYSKNILNNKTVNLTPYDKVRIQLMSINSNKNSDVYIKLNKRDSKIFDLYKLNAITADLKLVEKNNGDISYWQENLKGEIKLAIATDGVNERFLYKTSNSNKYEEVLHINFTENFYPISFTEDGTNLYALSSINRDKTALIVFDLINKKEKSIIYENKNVEVSDVVFSKKNNKPLYAAYHTSKYQIQSLSKEIDKLKQVVHSNLNNQAFRIINFNVDENKFLIKTITDKNYGAYYIYNSDSSTLKLISEENKSIDKNILSDVNPISFKSRDNLELSGYLTLPKHKEKSCPLIVIASSSPWVRTTWDYNPDVQFLANRGYAVLQVNQRGADGFGKSFQKAGFKELGNKMQDDIADGVKYLINTGIVDSNRVAIVGFSFGGMMALNGIVRDSGLYKCAVSYSGHINLFTYLKGIPPYYNQYLEMIYEMLGNPEKDYELFRQCSPVFHADKIHVPVFIAQGEKDNRVSTTELSDFVKKLERQNTTVKYLLIKEEGHGFKKLENKYTLYSEVELFLEQNLKNLNGQ